ncbi:hypothetical protein VTO42DRAFT_7579 [Malbranchea cinnamomea]
MSETSTSATHPTTQGGGTRGRGRAGGGSDTRSSADHSGAQQPHHAHRGRRGGGRGGNRGGFRGRRQEGQGGQTQVPRGNANDAATSSEPPDPGVADASRAPGTSGDRLTGDARRAEGEANPQDKGKGKGKGKGNGKGKEKEKLNSVGVGGENDEEAEDGEVCFICASRVEHIAVAPCNHRTCHICSLRLRALYKTKACAHCRTESNFVIFTDDPVKRYEAFGDSDFVRTDDNLGIKYETAEIFEDTVLLLRYNCPDKECEVACLGWPDLHRHVKSKHGKVMCDLCTRNKKVFTHEHELFTMNQLRRHERYGDDIPGTAVQSGFKGHPECGFCRTRFYGDDELYAHCRDKHERCHICDRRSGGRQHQYYIDYDALEEHFKKDHFLCMDRECLEKKFVVFESQMDLKAHQLEVHPAGLSKDARRDARHVDISTFDYRTPYQPARGRRGAGRGRDPNAEPLPVSSAQPLRRDELAYQRQIAIQSAQSVTTRTFGGQLTRPPPQQQQQQAPQPAARPSQPATSAPQPSLPPIETLDIGSTPPPPSTPQEAARQVAHQAVIDRAAALLRNDALKLNIFRSRVSSYRKSTISASDLIESFFSLFDASPTELGKLIKELAHLYEDESKRTGLLQAWNDWRAINEDYPALPGPSGTSPLTTSAIGGAGAGKRVLRLKSSTTQSSRSAVGPRSTLAGVLNSGNSNAAELFPSLGGGHNARTSSKPGTAPTAWATPTPAGSARTLSSGISPTPSRSASTRPAVTTTDTEAFPSLPPAPKPNTLMAGLTRGAVRWEDRGRPTTNAWTGASTDPTPAEAAADAVEGAANDDKKGKGKKGNKGKKGQVLYHFG